MKKSLLFLLLLPSLAFASPPKVAMFTNPSFPNFQWRQLGVASYLNRAGIGYDVYDPNVRTWGASGVADSTWFRQRYSAVIIPYNEVGNAVGSVWGSNFQDAAAATGVIKGPLGGRWTIPVFVNHGSITVSASYNDTTDGDRYVAGITQATSSFAKPNETNGGTWRYRLLGKFYTEKDTLYSDPNAFICKQGAWLGPGSTAALIFADTSNGLGTCSPASRDTPTVMWRYRPKDNLPGIYHSLFLTNMSNNQASGVLPMLQYMMTVTDIKPVVKPRVPLHIHDFHPVTLNAANKAALKVVTDVLIADQIPLRLSEPAEPCGAFSYTDADLRGYVNNYLNTGFGRWNIFPSGSCSGTNWHLAYFAGTDTGGVAIRWNRSIACGAAPDTFAFPMKYYDKFTVTASSGGTAGVLGTGKVMKDAGLMVFETLNQGSNSNWQFNAVSLARPLTLNPILLPDNRVVYVRFLISGYPENNTFTGLVGTSSASEYLGSNAWAGVLYNPVLFNGGLYVHLSNVINSGDPYFAWFLDLTYRYYRSFNKVCELDKDFIPSTLTPRNSYIARF